METRRFWGRTSKQLPLWNFIYALIFAMWCGGQLLKHSVIPFYLYAVIIAGFCIVYGWYRHISKHSIFVISVLAIVGVVLFFWVVPQSWFLSGMVERVFGPIIPASSYARTLDSQDNDLVRENLYTLTQRGDPVAIPRAIQLLQSSDDYVWLNAALYLGKCKRPEAVPYLIKALRHTASRSDSEKEQYLREITGKDFGVDFARWQSWWVANHPYSKLDWTSHLGPIPRV